MRARRWRGRDRHRRGWREGGGDRPCGLKKLECVGPRDRPGPRFDPRVGWWRPACTGLQCRGAKVWRSTPGPGTTRRSKLPSTAPPPTGVGRQRWARSIRIDFCPVSQAVATGFAARPSRGSVATGGPEGGRTTPGVVATTGFDACRVSSPRFRRAGALPPPARGLAGLMDKNPTRPSWPRRV